jgi:DNA replication protein DnaC
VTWIDEARATQWHPSQRKPLELPVRFRSARIHDVPVPALRQAATDYVLKFWDVARDGIAPCFVGKAKSFKTHTACCVAMWVEQIVKVETAFADIGNFLNRFDGDRFNDVHRTYYDWLCRVPFLVADDFANTRPKSWASDMLTDLASRRFNATLPTLWTANLVHEGDRVKIADLYGAAFSRRVHDGARGYTVIVE